MKQFKTHFAVFAGLLLALTACQKSETVESTDESTSPTIAVAATVSADPSVTVTDSVYILQRCDRGFRREALAQASLPADVTTYLSANYSGYVFHKAFAIKSSTDVTAGYVVIVYYNSKPVALAFSSAGAFEKVLEQREKGDLDGKGWHHGGRFADREGKGKDTVALASLSAAIKTYFSANYPGDTLLKAFRNRDSSYVVLSKNNGAYATVFTSASVFVKRVQLPVKEITAVASLIDVSALPVLARTFLEAAFPNFVFKSAFSLTVNNVLRGFVVVFDANNTKYAVEFNAAGTFVRGKVIY
ncbi:hypothetical protein V9K67_06685 [Paraflavisolibacter sp. H34]|uniref:hypothetical protein n=1 Tax=Huijunlia imazamoxiresistens TaxID=3127457 RepID=UPI0030160B27